MTTDQVYEDLKRRGLNEEIVYNIVDEASSYFEECPNDFCLNAYSSASLVFGKKNQLYWRIGSGFTVDEAISTKQFVKHAKGMM